MHVLWRPASREVGRREPEVGSQEMEVPRTWLGGADLIGTAEYRDFVDRLFVKRRAGADGYMHAAAGAAGEGRETNWDGLKMQVRRVLAEETTDGK